MASEEQTGGSLAVNMSLLRASNLTVKIIPLKVHETLGGIATAT